MKIVVTIAFLIIFSATLTIALRAQIIISEIMQDPAAVTDANGEWFELYNSSGADIDIDGWTIRDDGTDNHLINNGGPLIISAGGFLVLGNNGDTGTNGGVPIDYVITGTFFIGNSDDELILEDDSTPTLVEIDRVEYDGGPNWPDPTGASMVFSGLASDDNNDGSLWITAPSREPNWINTNPLFTDLGSPGANGSDQHLPVELTSFTAVGGDNKVSLKWVTQSEIDNQGFYLYRSNDKEGTYSTLSDLIKGAGNSSSQITYTYVDASVFNGITYWYKLIDVDVNGVRTEHPAISAVPHISSTDLGVIDNSELPKEFALKGNYPNPFNPETTISFDIPETANELVNVNLSVYNMLGQKIITLLNEPLSANSYRVKWYGKDSGNQLVPSGVYFYLLKTENFISSHKMMLIK